MFDVFDHDSFEQARRTFFRFCIIAIVFVWLEIDLTKINIFGVKLAITEYQFKVFLFFSFMYLAYVFGIRWLHKYWQTLAALDGSRMKLMLAMNQTDAIVNLNCRSSDLI